jgi:hypothetical protein
MSEDRRVPAPGLMETAEIWWDAEVAPVIEWDRSGQEFTLLDASDPGNRLLLWRAASPVHDPGAVAAALAEGLAACDFPPTGEGVSPQRAAVTLRVAGLSHLSAPP